VARKVESKQGKAKVAKPQPLPPPIRNGDTITITLPLPPRELQPNIKTKINPYKLTKLIKGSRESGYWATRIALQGETGWQGARLDYEFWTAARMDLDNAEGLMKHVRDGIAQALGCDDKHFTRGEIVQHSCRKADALRQVVVRITKVGIR
jgi:hypothetical protein